MFPHQLCKFVHSASWDLASSSIRQVSIWRVEVQQVGTQRVGIQRGLIFPLTLKSSESNRLNFSQKQNYKVDSSKFCFDDKEPLYDVIPPIRALSLKESSPSEWRLLQNLMSHLDNWMVDPEWKESHQYIIDFILDTIKVS